MFDPGVLGGPGDVYDDEDRETVGREELRSLAVHYERIAILISAIESGSVTVSISEFERLPATFEDAWRIFREVRAKIRAKNDRKIASP